ncbi:MAG: DUF4150 domain-containing protein [Deltaproteobacteria bacterium]|jgi:hypothetical protein|nr:DUF4150 domain-containing protein [Deltaproteobacteria bacterium]MBW2533387.1 DUF4150 domain-containing protein [Deltaproteobacteria bacterium]
MGFTTYANSLSVAGRATAHAARCILPDVCYVPGMIPTPFPNYIFTTELGTGATTNTRICGDAVWTAKGKLDKTPSLPAHAGTIGGVVTGTYIQWAQAITFSGNVLAEGAGVVRLTDFTIQNTGNTLGMVVDADSIAGWLAGWGSGAGSGDVAATAGDEDPADDGPPEEAEDDAGETVDDPTDQDPQTEGEPECELVSTTIKCAHGRGPGGTSLEILNGDTIKFTANYQGECPDGIHPKWLMPGGTPAEVTGPEGSIKVYNRGAPGVATSGSGRDAGGSISGGSGDHAGDYKVGGSARRTPGSSGAAAASGFNAGLNIGKLIELSTATPTRYALTAEAHVGNAEWEILAYPADKAVLDDLIPEGVRNALESLEKGVNSLSKGAKGSIEGSMSFLKGNISINGGWEEHSDHTCFFGFQVDIGFKPLISASLKIYIPFGPLEGIRKLLGKIGVHIGLYVEIFGSCDLVLSVGRKAPGAIPGADLKATLTAGLAVGGDITISKKAVHAEVRGEGSLSCDYGISCSQLFRADVMFYVGDAFAGPVKGIAKVSTTSGAIGVLLRLAGGEKLRNGVVELSGEYTFIEKKLIMNKRETVLIKAG